MRPQSCAPLRDRSEVNQVALMDTQMSCFAHQRRVIASVQPRRAPKSLNTLQQDHGRPERAFRTATHVNLLSSLSPSNRPCCCFPTLATNCLKDRMNCTSICLARIYPDTSSSRSCFKIFGLSRVPLRPRSAARMGCGFWFLKILRQQDCLSYIGLVTRDYHHPVMTA
ncbi:hypothetical protein VTG60DRAFT_5234 [Thermothelomyces hinnuleus]